MSTSCSGELIKNHSHKTEKHIQSQSIDTLAVPFLKGIENKITSPLYKPEFQC